MKKARMKNILQKTCVLLWLALVLSPLHGQNTMTVRATNGTQTAHMLSNMRKQTFPDINNMLVTNITGDPVQYALSGVRHVRFTDNAAPSDIALSASAIDENVTANSTVGTLSSTDANAGNTFTYTLVAGTGSTDNASFNINGSSLKITASPNFEVKSSYSVLIRTTDQGGLYFEKAFSITINNLSETPTVTTQAVSNISAATATGNGNITSLGEPSPTAYGVCWNTTGSPTIDNSKTDKGAIAATGAFTADITGLTAGTTYYVRAFATNSVNTSYGSQVSFIFTNADKGLTDLVNPAISDVAVADGFKFTSNAAGQTVNSISVEPGAKLELTNALTVTGDLTLKANDNSSFSATVGAGVAVYGNVKYVKTMNRDQWYFISFPCDVLKSDITLSDGSTLGQFGAYDNVSLASDWDVKYYDGTTRASTGKTDGSNWKTIAGNKLEAYKGYIFWLKAGAGTLDVTFKLNNSLVASENVRTIPVLGNQVGALKSNKGWNLVGQPYLSRYAGGKAGINFMTFPDGVAAQTYTTLRSSENAGNGKIIDPFTAYFVQVDNSDDITFTIDGRSSAPASVNNNPSDMLQLNLTTATGTDNTNLIIDNDQTTEYTIGQDMVKWLGTGTAKPQVYTRLDNLNFSYNALPLASVVNLPLGFYTLTASKTTISANATSARSLSKLLLWDNTAKIETDLLTSNYSFTADAGTNNTRFTISAQRVPTATEMAEKVGAPTIITMQTKMLVSNLTGENNILVYDAIGKVIFSKHTVNSSLEIPITVSGMYTVKIESSKKLWTLKTVF